MSVIPQEITHLDFDVEVEEPEPCVGIRLGSAFTVTHERVPGHAVAQVRAQYGCCGLICYLCLACYNDVVSLAEGTNHVVNKGSPHKQVFPVFSNTTWLNPKGA